VLLAYVDESFSEDWYYMAALLCEGAGVQAITADLDAVVGKAVAAYGVPDNAELHGYELFQGKGWWTGTPPRARINVYGQAFKAVASHGQAVIRRGVKTARLKDRYGDDAAQPHSVVLRHLLERINEYARARGEQVLVIADEVGEQSRHRSDLDLYRQRGTGGYRAQKLDRIIDTLHFAPSNASRMIQAIDLITFLYRRMEQHQETDPRAHRANEALAGLIQPLIVHSHCWHP
jgi:hypothetical protein